MRKLGRPKGTIKRITVSSHIKQDLFVQLAKAAAREKVSISKLIANSLEECWSTKDNLAKED